MWPSPAQGRRDPLGYIFESTSAILDPEWTSQEADSSWKPEESSPRNMKLWRDSPLQTLQVSSGWKTRKTYW